MNTSDHFDVIIIGGSYSGLAAGMALGRALRNVLIIDSGKPCNIQTPHSHNFLTQDGKTPGEIATIAKMQVAKYNTISFLNGVASTGKTIQDGFEIRTESGEIFTSKKLIFASGIKDTIPDTPGFSECWGISVLHCPYCHGYEVSNEPTGILGNGEDGFELSKLISNWTKQLTLYTNGSTTLSTEQTALLEKHEVKTIEKQIEKFEHINGYLNNLIFKDGTNAMVKAIYTRNPFQQNCLIPVQLGCELTEDGFIKTNPFQNTSVNGIFACGDNTTRMRSIANAVATGTFAGAAVNKELIEESF